MEPSVGSFAGGFATHAPPITASMEYDREEEEDRFSLDSDSQWLQLQDDTAQQDALDKEERQEAAELQVC